MDNKVSIVVGSQDDSKLDLDSLKRKLTDMGRMIETARVDVKGDKESEVRVERLALKLAALGRRADSPRIGLEGAARAEVEIAAVGLSLDKLGSEATASEGKLARLGSGLGTSLKGIGGLAAGGLAAGLAGPFAAAGLAAGAFGAVAIPILTKVKTANDALAKAQQQYDLATTKSQRVAALKAEAAATAGLTGQQKGLMGQVGQLSGMWHSLESAMTPVVVGVAQMGIGLAQALMPAMDKLVPAGAKVIGAVLAPMEKLFSSPFFSQFIAQMSQLAGQVAPMLGQQLVKLLVVFMQMFMQAGPAAVQVLGQLLPAIVQIVGGLVPFIVAVTKITAFTVTWLAKNHLLIPALGLLGEAIVGVGLAMDSTPVGAIIAGFALMIGAVTQLWQTSQKFRQIVTDVFSVVGRAVLTFAEIWLDELHIVTNIWLTAVGIIVHGAAAALGWVPGVGPALKAAVRGFDAFKDGVNNVFNAAHSKIEEWKANLAGMPRKVAIQGDISDLTAKLNAAKAQLRDPHLTATRRAAVQANIAQLEAAIARARAELNAINGTTAFTYVRTITSGGQVRNVGGHTLEHGGITGAAGGGPRSNLTLVGEHGRELVSLPPGAYVHSNPDTERMLGQGGGSQVVRVVLEGAGDDLTRAIAEALRKHARNFFGGSAQAAYGYGST